MLVTVSYFPNFNNLLWQNENNTHERSAAAIMHISFLVGFDRYVWIIPKTKNWRNRDMKVNFKNSLLTIFETGFREMVSTILKMPLKHVLGSRAHDYYKSGYLGTFVGNLRLLSNDIWILQLYINRKDSLVNWE